MTNKRYYFGQGANEFAESIELIMQLFGITRLTDDCPSCDDVIIKVSVQRDSNITVTTSLVYYDNRGLTTITKHAESRNVTDSNNLDDRLMIRRLVRLNVYNGMCQITGINPSPWGILRGVRPAKIVHRLLDQGMSIPETIDHLVENYALDLSKAQLIVDIAIRQRRIISIREQHDKVSIYIGIPFCPSRCSYCSFPAFVLPQQDQVTAFLAALEYDLKSAAELIRRYKLTVDTIYIGGGTPTSLSVTDFSWLLAMVNDYLSSSGVSEFTVEAGRPDSIDADKLLAMVNNKVTRVSINPQTMQEKTLKLIGRKHSCQDIIDVFRQTREIGIPVINMDIIIGLPGENENDVKSTIEQIIELQPENITIHTLALKKGSLLKSDMVNSRSQELPTSATAVKMFKTATDLVDSAGYSPYYLYRLKKMAANLENIGYSIGHTECRYNILVIEECQSIIGIGPSATSKAVDSRSGKLTSSYHPKDVKTYINKITEYVEARNDILERCFSMTRGGI